MLNIKKKILITLSLLIISLQTIHISHASPPHSIHIFQIVSHQALDDTKQGIIDELEQIFGKNNLNITDHNAQGNLATANQIAQKIVSQSPDMIVAISTPCAQVIINALKRNDRKIPVVFAAVTDAKSITQDNNLMISGTTDMPNIERQISHMLEIMEYNKRPLSRIGILYNASEDNSNLQVAVIKKIAKQKKLTLIESTVSSVTQISDAVKMLCPNVDAIYVPNDNLAVSTMDLISDLSAQQNIPVFAGDAGSVTQGALECLGIDRYNSGKKTAQVIAHYLKTKTMMPIRNIDDDQLFLNKKRAEQLKINYPQKHDKAA